MTAPTTLIEREPEQAALGGVTEAVGTGAGARAVGIVGPPGVGKSELLLVLRDRARDAGFLTLTARASEFEADFPFGIVRSLLGDHLRRLDDGDRDELLSGAAGRLRPLFDLAPAPRHAPAPAAMLHALYWLLTDLQADAPVAFLVDDAHWADPGSLHALAHLLSRGEDLALLVGLSARTGEADSASSAPLDTLLHDDRCTTIEPPPLTPSGVAAMAGSLLDAQADGSFLAACAAATGGNPFYVRELLRQVRAEGIPPTEAGVARVRDLQPRAVTHSVAHRLGAAGDDARRLAEAVAVLGDGIDIERAAELSGLELSEAASSARELTRLALLEDRHPLRFVHPLIRSAVYNEMTEAERAVLHKRAAGLVDARDGSAAVHLLHVAPAANERVVEHLGQAAADAMARGAPEAALRLLERAWLEPPGDPSRPGVARELLAAGLAAGELAVGERMDELLDALRADPAAIADAAVDLVLLGGAYGQVPRVLRVITETAGRIAAADPEVATRLEGSAALGAVFSVEVFTSIVEELAERPPPAGSGPGATSLLAGIAYARMCTGRPLAETGALAERALSGDLGTLTVSTGITALAVGVLGHCGRYEFSSEFLRARRDSARASGNVVELMYVSGYQSELGYLTGRLVDAEADARVSIEFGRNLRHMMTWSCAFFAAVAAERGHAAEALDLLREASLGGELPDHSAMWRLLYFRARAKVAVGDEEGGLADLFELKERLERWGAALPIYQWPLDAALIVARRGDRDHALELVAHQEQLALRWQSDRHLGAVRRVQGMVAGGDEGIEMMRQSLELLSAPSSVYERARTLVELGCALRRANQRKEARAALAEGTEIAARCGGTVLAERGLQELKVAGARPRRQRTTGVHALTASEQRISSMAAEGMSNREIAEALFVTLRTVEMHLSNSYRKLGIASRDQLPGALDELLAA